MPPKHNVQTLRLPRYSLIVAAATMLTILVGWVAIRAVGPSQATSPRLVVPSQQSASVVPAAVIASVPTSAPARPTSPAASARVSATPSRTPVASPSASSSPTPSKTKAAKPPAPVRTSASPTPPAPAAAFTARYRTTASWDTGFIGYVQVTNAGDAPGAWSVTVTYPSSAGVTIIGTWNAQRSGTTFTGDTLAPGASASFGFSANKQVRGKVKPSGCTVAGASCRIG